MTDKRGCDIIYQWPEPSDPLARLAHKDKIEKREE